jgi:hypothetical protein
MPDDKKKNAWNKGWDKVDKVIKPVTKALEKIENGIKKEIDKK